MSSREVAALTLKLLGVYTIIQALPLLQVIGALAMMPRTTVSSGVNVLNSVMYMYVGMLVPLILMAIAAYWLLTRSESLAQILVKEDRPLALPGSLASRDIQAIAFSVAGVLALLHGLPGICQLLAVTIWTFPSVPRYGDTYIWQRLWTSGVSPIVECILGVVLFFRSRGLVNLWHRLQSAGLPKADDTAFPVPPEQKNE